MSVFRRAQGGDGDLQCYRIMVKPEMVGCVCAYMCVLKFPQGSAPLPSAVGLLVTSPVTLSSQPECKIQIISCLTSFDAVSRNPFY